MRGREVEREQGGGVAAACCGLPARGSPPVQGSKSCAAVAQWAATRGSRPPLPLCTALRKVRRGEDGARGGKFAL